MKVRAFHILSAVLMQIQIHMGRPRSLLRRFLVDMKFSEASRFKVLKASYMYNFTVILANSREDFFDKHHLTWHEFRCVMKFSMSWNSLCHEILYAMKFAMPWNSCMAIQKEHKLICHEILVSSWNFVGAERNSYHICNMLPVEKFIS